MLGSLFGHVDKHVICKTMYYRFAKVAGVSASLMASKDKGEGEGRVTYETFVRAEKVLRSDILFSCFWRTKSSSVGRIDPGGSKHR